MKHLELIGLLALLGFTSCNLSEAERMDLSRSEISSVACVNPEVQFAGSDSVPVSFLLGAAYHQPLGRALDLVWIDPGTERMDQGTESSWHGILIATSKGSDLFKFVFDDPHGDGYVGELPANTNWSTDVGAISFQWYPNACNKARTPLKLRLYEDRPSLSIQIRNDLASLRNGDTLRVELQNQSASEAIQVASNYWGLRQVGDFMVSVKPGEIETMEWIVVASPGLSGWLDLSWGNYGQSRRIDFQTR